jgi:large subunit ribosomal protein L35
MPKRKTKKAAAKRFKKTATGKLLYAKSGTGHLLSGKNRKRKRQLRRTGVLEGGAAKRVGLMLAK